MTGDDGTVASLILVGGRTEMGAAVQRWTTRGRRYVSIFAPSHPSLERVIPHVGSVRLLHELR